MGYGYDVERHLQHYFCYIVAVSFIGEGKIQICVIKLCIYAKQPVLGFLHK
jgi:hypothetical protein